MLNVPKSRRAFVVVRDIAAPAARVFEQLSSEAGMQAWVPMCRSARWQHPQNARGPGVDSVRDIRLTGGVVAAERIVAWEPGRELHYVFDQTTLPIAALTRDYVGVTRIEPRGTGKCRLHWAIHFDSPGALALLRPLVIASLQPLIATMAGRLKRQSERR